MSADSDLHSPRIASASPSATSRDAARVVPGDRTLSGVVWLLLYPLAVLLPIVLMLVPPTPTGRSFWVEMSVALGFVGLTQIGIQFVLIGRFRPLTYPYGLDVVLKYHRQIALVAIAFVLLHPGADPDRASRARGAAEPPGRHLREQARDRLGARASRARGPVDLARATRAPLRDLARDSHRARRLGAGARAAARLARRTLRQHALETGALDRLERRARRTRRPPPSRRAVAPAATAVARERRARRGAAAP